MKSYRFSIEDGQDNYNELVPIYCRHYLEMQERLAKDGIPIADYAPRLDEYFKAFKAGYLINYVIRTDEGLPVGYSNVYITHDMHNGQLVAQEDTIYVLPEHRNGVGKKLVKFILDDLKKRGCVRGTVTPVTDLRVGKIWKRMGFKETAMLMTYIF